MEFRILGPLEVSNSNGAVRLGGTKPRAVLTVLLLNANQPVSAERLALALWGEEARPSAIKTVHVHVSRLRRALGDAEIVTTTAAGYCLRVRPGELDADRFQRLVDDGRRALADGQPERAAAVLREALALWRGPPLADLMFEPFAAAEIARLEEQRLTTLEARIEADLAIDRHAEVVGELQQLVAEHAARDRFAGQLMLALYRCGRQADALDVYREARRALIEELGVEPGPELRRLQEAILRQDAALESNTATAELPPELDTSTAPPLVGRREELDWLRARWEQAREGASGMVILAGVSGSGKLRLAAELAASVHDGGDAVLYATGSGPAEAFLVALRRIRQATRPTLLVIHAADRAGVVELAELESLSQESENLPVLVLACGEDADALADPRSDDVLMLEPLDATAVGAIARQYARGTAAEEVPADRLLEASGGVPRVVHQVASQWARREAARHVGAVAGRAAAEHAQLRSLQAELTGGVEDLQEARERITPRRWEAPVVCPFKGLASFDTADAPYFFGREKLVAELVARLVGAPLLGIVGPSGSGKSSVMRAGLLPALASGVLPASETWKHVLIRPGEHPLRELTDAMAAIDTGGQVVVAVDQFEETFTTCEDEAERAAFIAELSRMAGDRDGRHVVVIVLRADYYGRCAAYPQLAGLLAENHVLVRSMQRDELRRAIELPARRVGLRVDPQLADALVADVNEEPGALPLLSTALLELWQRRDGRHLHHAAYERHGGVQGAVARLAEDAFSQLDEAQQTVARGVLMRLVGTGDGDAVERRRVTLDELEVDRNENVARIVALLTDRRLLTVSSGTVEVSHEALLREWPRLCDWIEKNRDGIRIQRALTAAAHEWQRLGRDEAALYRGIRLVEALEWSDAPDAPLTKLEREFLTRGAAARARDRVTRRRRVGLVLAALTTGLVAAIAAATVADRERDIAESRNLATKSLSLVATDPGLALAVALEALRRNGTEQAQNALRQATLAHRATRVITAHDGLLHALTLSPDGRFAATAGGDRTVRVWSLRSGRRVREIRGYRDDVRAVSFSPDGKRIASAALNGEISLAATHSGRRDVIARMERDSATSIDFGADGKTLAIGTRGGRVALVRVSDGAMQYLRSGTAAPIYAVDFDRDAGKVVTAGADGFARIWSIADGRPLKLAHGGIVVAASFSPDGARVATAGFSGEVRVWDTSSGARLMRIPVSDQWLASVRFSEDGRRIVTGSFDGVIRLFAIRERAVLAEIKGHKGPTMADFTPGSGALVSAGQEDRTLRTLTTPATRLPLRPGKDPRFSRDGELVVSGDATGPIHVWNPATGEDRKLARSMKESHPQFSPDGSQVVSASEDGTVLLWNLEDGRSRTIPTLKGEKFAAAIDATGERIAIGGNTALVIQAPDGSHRLRLRQQIRNVYTLTFRPDGKKLVTGSDDGTARVWDARSGALERTLRGHEGIVRGVSYSNDGKLIATAGGDGLIRIWPADRDDPVLLAGHEDAVNTARFNDRGDQVVSAADDGTIRIWNAAGGEALVVLYQHKGRASGADFGDGRDVVSAGEDGMRITVCEICGTIAETLRVARKREQHELSAIERRRLLPGG